MTRKPPSILTHLTNMLFIAVLALFNVLKSCISSIVTLFTRFHIRTKPNNLTFSKFCFQVFRKSLFCLLIFVPASSIALTSVIESYTNQQPYILQNGGFSSAISPDNKYVYVGGTGELAVYSRNATTGELTFVDVTKQQNGGVTCSVVVSPDNQHVYAVSTDLNTRTVSIFNRDTSTGKLTVVENNQETTSFNSLSSGGSASIHCSITVPDNQYAYVTSENDDTLSVFSRNPDTGKLLSFQTFKNGNDGVYGIAHGLSITVSPDNKYIYVLGNSDIAIFSHDMDTDLLTFVEVEFVDNYRIEMTVSPDGQHIYVADKDNVLIFSRDMNTGQLTSVGTIVNQDYRFRFHFNNISIISPDNQHIYIAGGIFPTSGVAVFSRDPNTGQLTFIEFIKNDENTCVDGIFGPQTMVASSDNNSHVYVMSVPYLPVNQAIHVGNDSLLGAVFSRDTNTGQLTFTHTIPKRFQEDNIYGLRGASSVALSPDDKYLYVASKENHAVAVFSRDTNSGQLDFIEAIQDENSCVGRLTGASSVVVSPDNQNVYVASTQANALAIFSRNSNTGKLTFVDVIKDGVNGVDGLANIKSVAVGTDNKYLYVASNIDQSIVVFAHNTNTNEITFIQYIDLSSLGLNKSIGAVVVSPDNQHVYGTTTGGILLFDRDMNTGELTYSESFLDGSIGIGHSIIVSRDKQYVYTVYNFLDNNIIGRAFKRDIKTGYLTEILIVHDNNIFSYDDGSSSLAVNFNNQEVYFEGSIFNYDKNTGALTFSEKVVEGFFSKSAIFSLDNQHLYVVGNDTITAFDRINQAPVNLLPGVQTTEENTPLTFASGDLIEISDVDVGSLLPVEITIIVTNGLLNLSTINGLTFSEGDGIDDTTMIFMGNISNANTALDGMVFTPTPHFSGEASIEITTDDLGYTGNGGPLTDTETLVIKVNPINEPPVLDNIGSKSVNLDNTLHFQATASDPNDIPSNRLQFSLSGAPTGAVINPLTGEFTWKATESGKFTFTVTITEIDGVPTNFSDSEEITVSVGNTPPVLKPIGQQRINMGETVTFIADAEDSEQAHGFIYRLNNGPPGAMIDPITGTFTWTATGIGIFDMTVEVTDNGRLTDSELVTITVSTDPILAPIGNKNSSVNSVFSFTVHATHPGNNPLAFSLTDAPAGAAIDPQTGVFTWSPTQKGNFNATIVITDTLSGINVTETITIIITAASTSLDLELSSPAIFKNGFLGISGKFNRYPSTATGLENQTIQLIITSPDDDITTINTQTDFLGEYLFTNLPNFDQDGFYFFQAIFPGTEALQGSQSSMQSVSVTALAGYALLIQGRTADGSGMNTYNKSLNRIYRIMKSRGFVDENIEYFNYNTNQSAININVDNIPNKSAIQAALQGFQTRLNADPAPFYIVMVNHGGMDGDFHLDNGDGENIMPYELNSWLNTLESSLNPIALAQPRVVIVGTCYSGNFIPTLSKLNRIIVTSTAASEESYKGPKEPDEVRSGEFFMEAFFSRLGRGYSLKSAFEIATESTERLTRSDHSEDFSTLFQDNAVQHPLLDDNGDKQGSNVLYNGQDGMKSVQTYLGLGPSYETDNPDNSAEIWMVTPSIYLEGDQSAANLFATVNNPSRVANNIVTVDIRPPSVVLTPDGIEQSEQLEIQGLHRVSLIQEGNRFASRFDAFNEIGKYELFYFVIDSITGKRSPLKRSIVYKGKPGNNPPQPINLQWPLNNSEIQTSLIFDWDSTLDPEGDELTYTLLIATDPLFNQVVYRQEELTLSMDVIDNETVIDDPLNEGKPGLRDGTEYFWSVTAIDKYGASADSPVFSLTTNNTNAPPSVAGLHLFSAVNFTSLEEATIEFFQLDVFGNPILDEFGNPIPIEHQPIIHEDQGIYQMLMPPFGRRRVKIKVPGFESQEVDLDSSENLAKLNLEMIPVEGIPINHGQLQFTISRTLINENQNSIRMIVNRIEGSDGEVSISYMTTDGSAIVHSDYIDATGTLTWLDGEKISKHIPLTIIDDKVIDADETFTVILHAPTGGATLGTNHQMQVTIVDDDGKNEIVASEEVLPEDSTSSTIGDETSPEEAMPSTTEITASDQLQFATTTYTANEGDGILTTITVTRSENNVVGEVSVQYIATTASTATLGNDYTSDMGTLHWLENDNQPKTVNITLLDDSEVEVSETVHLLLFNPTGNATLGNQHQTTLTIIDNEGDPTVIEPITPEIIEPVFIDPMSLKPGTLQFMTETYTLNERIGDLTTFTVTRQGGYGGAVSVHYKTRGESTAKLGRDYLGGSGKLHWANGDNTPKPIDLTLLEDSEEDDLETIELSLYTPTRGAKLGTPKRTTLIIIDSGYVPPPSGPGVLQFSAPEYFAKEGEGLLQHLTVTRIDGSDGQVSVQYVARASTATDKQDYEVEDLGTLVWAEGDNEPKPIALTVLDDNSFEGVEVVRLMLFNAKGDATLGTPAETEITILDDDKVISLPNLGQGIIVMPKSPRVSLCKKEECNTIFRGGVSNNGKDYQKTLTLPSPQMVKIRGEIEVNAAHVGQEADILIVMGLPTNDAKKVERWLMLDNKGQSIEWNGVTATLVAAQNVILTSNQTIEIYQGFLPQNQLRVFFGYRLNNDLVIFNGEQPIEVHIEE